MPRIRITKEADDTQFPFPVLRASIGGNVDLGYYVVYRGDRDAIALMLEECMSALRDKTHPEIRKDN